MTIKVIQLNKIFANSEQQSASTTSYAHDANGNLTEQDKNGVVTSFSWDDADRLIEVSYPDGSEESYEYSAEGKRTQKVRTAAGLAQTTRFIWDGENVLQEREDASMSAQYTDNAGMWGGLVSQRRGGASSFYGFDSQQNTRLLMSSLGVVSDGYSYRAFGEELSTLGVTANPLRFGGQVGY